MSNPTPNAPVRPGDGGRAEMLTPEWMRAHAQEYCADKSRSSIAAPFPTLIDGTTRTVATNGHVLLDVPGHFGFAANPDQPSSLHGVMRGVPTQEGVTISLHALRDFLGLLVVKCDDCKDSGLVECDECMGDGDFECSCASCGHEHQIDCEECKGKGEVPCLTCRANARERIVRIGDRGFNREVLATAIRHLPFETVVWQQGDESRPSVISGEWGRVLIMPVRGDAVRESSPVFALSVQHA